MSKHPTDEIVQEVMEEPKTYKIKMSNGEMINAKPVPNGVRITRNERSSVISHEEMIQWLDTMGPLVNHE